MKDNKIFKIILEDLQKLNEKKKADGMRSVKKGADDNPKVTKMDFLPNIPFFILFINYNYII